MVSELELGHFQVGVEVGVGLRVAVEHGLGFLGLPHTLLKLEVAHPGLLARAPLHPPVEDVPRLGVVADEFLHVGVLKPELVLSGEIIHCTLPHVPGVVDELVLHLHLGVLEPQ